MGRRSRNRAARREAIREPEQPIPGMTISGAAERLEKLGWAVVTLMTPDAETGTAYVRQWYLPEGQTGDFAEMMTCNTGAAPLELIVNAEKATENVCEAILAVGDNPFISDGTPRD